MDPDVARVQPFDWVDGDWRSDHRPGTSSVFVCGLDPHADGMLFARALPEALRALLAEPGAVIVDRADVGNLGVGVGDRAYINGHTVRVVGISNRLRALGGVDVLASLATARELNDSPTDGSRTTFLLVGLRHAAQAPVVARRLSGAASFGPYQVWTAAQFARRSQMHWILDTGAGVAVLFLALVVFLVGAVITSQTLIAAVVASIREYATLNALGVGRRALRRIVMEQAFWVGALGLVGSALLGAVLFVAAREHAIPIALDSTVIAACLALNMALAIVSGLFALRSLRRADPASLLR
jgi:putative ABC transport system permease protein